MSPKPPLPPGMEALHFPEPLPPETPRVDKKPQAPHILPEFAQPLAAPPPPKVAVSRSQPAASSSELDIQSTIQKTHLGVEALQILIEPPEGPTRAEMILELLETIDNRTFRLEERQKSIERMLAAITTHLRLTVPKA